jgi:hypothetical protein
MAATSNGTPAPKPVRCAIYTRKSTEEGLNQEFNSLDAQREAAEAYIVSQKHDGWTLVPTQYSDGGYTGANIERPGVRQLLADIEAGKIDCVVVYKVDRLSRSLIDFARMMELFEKRGVCFVCHAIFDLENDPVSLDFRDQSQTAAGLSEVRARAFAQECLVPRPVLVHYTSQLGVHWQCLTAQDIAKLIASIHVEQATLLRAAYDGGFISEDQLRQYLTFDCSGVLREISYHAWTTREFLRQQAGESPKWIAENRGTTVGTRSLRLPAGYVKQVIDTLNMGEISVGKASELLMMDRYTFADRFGDLIEPVAV